MILDLLQKSRENISVANDMVVRVNGLVTPWLIIAENMVVTITQALASAGFYVDVTNDMLVTVS